VARLRLEPILIWRVVGASAMCTLKWELLQITLGVLLLLRSGLSCNADDLRATVRIEMPRTWKAVEDRLNNVTGECTFSEYVDTSALANLGNKLYFPGSSTLQFAIE
jgi:hypothetical protein